MKVRIMAIANLTEDSFHAPSRLLGKGGAVDIPGTVSRIGQMIMDGADIIDIGASSSRPGTGPGDPEVEWARIGAVLPPLLEAFPDITVSIDTIHSSVISRAAQIVPGDRLIANDITAGLYDPDMVPLCARLDLGYVAMHMKPSPHTRPFIGSDEAPEGDIIDMEINFFRQFERRAGEAGLKDWILDPGFGFGLSIEENYRVLDRLEDFKVFDRPILAGLSRKSMIYKPLGLGPEDVLSQTQVLNAMAVERGAAILRVHDVKETAKTLQLLRLTPSSRHQSS